MEHSYFFGYGSLVNRNTHEYRQAHRARIKGWQRAWRRSPLRAVCYLTAVPAQGGEIDGLIAAVPGGNWAALDIRERAYMRHTVTDHVSHDINHDPEVAIYAIESGKHHAPGVKNPILLSYLDVVVQGYLAEFGQQGVARFFASTTGWQTPILNDRAEPVYPRAQMLTKAETELVDQHICGFTIITN